MRLSEVLDPYRRQGFSPFTPFLAFFSYLYGIGLGMRHVAYRKRNRQALPGMVVSIGNLTVGGTGKTPATCMLAEWARGEGYPVAVLSRGYGGSHEGNVLEVSDGNVIKAGPAEAGDEPYLMSRRLNGVPVIVSKKRYPAGEYARRKFGAAFFVLDDGFQHWALKRDLDLVLIDAADPFGNGRLLPWGPLREPVGQLRRADALILTRSEEASRVGAGENGFSKRRIPDKPLFRANHTPHRVFFPEKNEVFDPGFLRGRSVIGFAGIARPSLFKDTLISLGADPVFFQDFKDHHPFSTGDIRDLINRKERMNAEYLVTTEKDWIRLENHAKGYDDLAYVTINFNLTDDHDRFFSMIREKTSEVLNPKV